MKKYICCNCGFRSSLQVENIKRDHGTIHHKCRNCNAVAFPAKIVLESTMRSYMMEIKLSFRMD